VLVEFETLRRVYLGPEPFTAGIARRVAWTELCALVRVFTDFVGAGGEVWLTLLIDSLELDFRAGSLLGEL
jgi:hypothetical protein